MKCIICDRCGKVIKKANKARVITCAKPLAGVDSCVCENAAPVRVPQKKPLRETVWEKELCETCLDELEALLDPEEPVEPKPDVPPEPVEPDPPEPGPEDGGNTEGGESGGEGTGHAAPSNKAITI